MLGLIIWTNNAIFPTIAMTSMLNIFMFSHTKRNCAMCTQSSLDTTLVLCCVVCHVGSVFKGERERERENSYAMQWCCCSHLVPHFLINAHQVLLWTVGDVSFFENFLKTFPILTVVWFELTNKRECAGRWCNEPLVLSLLTPYNHYSGFSMVGIMVSS